MKNIFKILLSLVIIFKFSYLDRIPVFVDEATYLMVADIVRKEPSQVINLSRKGILPGLITILAFFEQLFGKNPHILILGRILSVFCEIISSFFIYLIGVKFFDPVTGLISLLLYLLLPFNNLHGRLVMLEPLMFTLFLISLYVFIKVIDKVSITKIFLTIFFLAWSFITKPLVIILLGTFLTLPLVYQNNIPKSSLKKKYLITFVIIFLFLLLVLPLFLSASPHYYNDYISRNINLLWVNFKINLWRSYLWLKLYYPLPILICSLGGVIYGILSKDYRITWFLFWILNIIILDSFILGKLFYPRHLFPLTAPFVYLSSILLAHLYQRKAILARLLIIFVFIFLGVTSFKLIYQPQRQRLTPEDKLQFFEDWSSGIGLDNIAFDLKKISQKRKINVYVGDEVLLTWALPNLFDIGQAEIIPINNYLGGETTINLEKKIQRGETQYLVLNKEPYLPQNFKATLLSAYPKGPYRKIVLYRLDKYD